MEEPDQDFSQEREELMRYREVALRLCEQQGFEGMEITESFTGGTLNTVFLGNCGGREYCIRLRTGTGFLYENVCKEPFVLACLEHGTDSDKLRADFQSILKSKQGYIESSSSLFAEELWYSFDGSLPYNGVIYPWIDEGSIERDRHFYSSAGALLAELHKISFNNFYANLYDYAENRVLSFAEKLRREFQIELEKSEGRIDKQLLRDLEQRFPTSFDNPRAVLVHNDFYARNLLVDDRKKLYVIDWDNWKIDAAELDLVKMRYWTEQNEKGLSSNTTLYQCFEESYADQSSRELDEELLEIYSLLWLLRVFNFESDRRERGIVLVPGFPAVDYYRQQITKLLT